jgi:transketolase
MVQEYVELIEKAQYLRQRAFKMVMDAGRGHLGGSFSCVEILVSLYYGGILKFDAKNPNWEERDRFIMSKGHSNNTLYVLLADIGFFDKCHLGGFTKDGALLGGHCDRVVPGIDASTGSLGHGLGMGCGVALNAQIEHNDYKTFVVLGDGECQEGSTWEAIAFAGHHKLNNLIAIVDRNMLGAEEFTEISCSLEPLKDRFESFGWETRRIYGHSLPALMKVLRQAKENKTNRPFAIIAYTIKGKGISWLENHKWAHHTLPTGDQIKEAEIELDIH